MQLCTKSQNTIDQHQPAFIKMYIVNIFLKTSHTVLTDKCKYIQNQTHSRAI